MQSQDLALIHDCLADERRVINYFKDLYALDILERVIGAGAAISELKSGQWKTLLHRPAIQQCLRVCGDGQLTPGHLYAHYRQHDVSLVRGLDSWGDEGAWHWNQTSRPGANLVVMLGLDRHSIKHSLRRMGASTQPRWLRSGHPQIQDRLTLAWARVDIDFQSGEALIEEIQSDFVRYLGWLRPHTRRLQVDGEWKELRILGGVRVRASEAECLATLHDLRQQLAPIWAEAMLMTTLRLLWDDLGITSIYYHSFEGGAAMKGISSRLPPRSLYTTLPKQFGFIPHQDAPEFIQRACAQSKPMRKRLRKSLGHEGPQFWRLPSVA